MATPEGVPPPQAAAVPDEIVVVKQGMLLKRGMSDRLSARLSASRPFFATLVNGRNGHELLHGPWAAVQATWIDKRRGHGRA